MAWLPGEYIPFLISKMTNPVGIELGTYQGDTTEYLLKNVPNLKLYGIDPYQPYIDWNGGTMDNPDGLYDFFMNKISPYGVRYHHYRQTSDDAVVNFADENFDFIFIDGLHTYEQVLKDMENYYPKIKKGGLFSGHDFKVIDGVNKAVIEFASRYNKIIDYDPTQDVWYWYKD